MIHPGWTQSTGIKPWSTHRRKNKYLLDATQQLKIFIASRVWSLRSRKENNYASLIVSTYKVNSKRITHLTGETFDTETRQTQKYCLPVARAPSLLLGKNQVPFGNLRGKKKGVRPCTSWCGAWKKLFIISINTLLTFNGRFYTRGRIICLDELFVWLFVSSVKTGTRRVIRLDELSSVVRRSTRAPVRQQPWYLAMGSQLCV